MRWGTHDSDRVRLDPVPLVLLVALAAAVFALGQMIGDPGAPWEVRTATLVTEPTADTSSPTTSTSPDPVTPSTVAGPVGSVTSSAHARRGTSVPVTTPPQPVVVTAPVWSGPIPNYRGRGACTVDAATVITSVFAAAGASVATQEWALLVASRETGCDTSLRNLNPRTGDDSYGWCQLNARAGHFGSSGILAGFDRDRILVDLDYASRACVRLWSVCGRGPWTPPYSCSVPPELR
jgi:hypothetical protein